MSEARVDHPGRCSPDLNTRAAPTQPTAGPHSKRRNGHKTKRAGSEESWPKNFVLLLSTAVSYPLDTLAAQCRQAGLAMGRSGGAQKEGASVSGGHRLNARCYKSADHHGGQDRDLCYQLCIHSYLHCLTPWGPGEFLLGSTVASALT